MSLEEPLTDEEKERLHKILADPSKLDRIIDQALKGWRRSRVWRQKTKRS